MFVCSCKAVTDRTVRAAIASDARTIDDLAVRCGAGSKCGGCWPELRRLLDETSTVDAPSRAVA
jgi:bacterioferritin-associated ferredoxin